MWDFGIDPVAIDVDPEGYDGPPGRALPFMHRSGWLRVSLARFDMPFITWRRTLIACVTDRGEVLSPNIACRLFSMPVSRPREPDEHPPEELDEVMEDLYADFLSRTDQDNLFYLEEASEQADARLRRFETRGAALLAKIEAATRALRKERRRPGASAEDASRIDAQLARLSTIGDAIAAEQRRQAAGIRGETAGLEGDIFAALRGLGTVEERQTVRWRAVPARYGRPIRFEVHRAESEMWSLVVRDRSTQVRGMWRW